MEPRPAAIRLLVPGNIRHNSGGNVYNASLADALTRLGVRVDVEPVDGIWPVGSSEARRRLAGTAVNQAQCRATAVVLPFLQAKPAPGISVARPSGQRS